MAKTRKPGDRKDHTARPQPAQINAIERCLDEGRIGEAGERLQRLRAAFPGFKPLYRLAYDIADAGGSDALARAAALDWSAAAPNSAAALEALMHECVAGGFPWLALDAFDRLVALPDSPLSPDADYRARLCAICDPRTSETDGRKLDRGRLLLDVGRAAEALAAMEGMTHPRAGNNAGLALFSLGRIDEAVAAWEAAVAGMPDNAFAGERLVAMRLWQSGQAAARRLAEELFAMPAKTDDDAVRAIVAWMLLDLPARAESEWRAAMDRDPGGHILPTLARLGACLAWWRDDGKEAIDRLERISGTALDADEQLAELGVAARLGALMGEEPDWDVAPAGQWWPIAHLQSLNRELLTGFDALFDHWGLPMPHPDYLAAAMCCGDGKTRALAIAALQRLALRGDESVRSRARDTLIDLLCRPCGPDAVRADIQRWLAEQGLIERGMPVAMRIGGKITETRPLDITIRTDAMADEPVLDTEGHKAYEAAIDLGHCGRIDEALSRLETLLPRYPDYPRLLTAVAAMREACGQAPSNWQPLIEKAAAVDPDYFFSRTAMAKLCAGKGRLEEARDWLQPLLDRKEMHSSEWKSLLLAQLEIAKADGDPGAIGRVRGMLKDAINEFG